MVAQSEPEEREHVKVEPDDEYFHSERGRLIVLGLRLRRLVFGRCAAHGGLLLRCVHLLEVFQRLPVQDLDCNMFTTTCSG